MWLGGEYERPWAAWSEWEVLNEGWSLRGVADGGGYFVYVKATGAGVEDVAVDATAPVELVGWTVLLHMAGAERVDDVSIDYLADVVGNDDDGATALDGFDAGFDLLGGYGVEAGGGFVKEDDGWVF